MKAIILNGALLVALALMAATPLLAQGGRGMGQGPGGDPEERLERRVSHMEDRLDLSEEQASELKQILEDQHARMSSEREARVSAIEAILTDDQKEKYQGMRDDFWDRRNHRRGRRGAFMDDLDLSDEQREQLDALRTSHRAAMRSWREQNPDASREDFQAFREDLHKSGRAAMEGFLSAEQLEKMDVHRETWGDRGGARGRKARRGRLAEQLNLSDDQKAQLGALREQQCSTMRDGFKSILTVEQFEELDGLREAGKHRRGRAGGWMGDCWK